MAYHRHSSRVSTSSNYYLTMNDSENFQSQRTRSEQAPKLRKSHRTRRRHSHKNGHGGSSTDDDGPSLITMLFIAVALATIFNLSKSGSKDPVTINFKGHSIRGGLTEEQYLRAQAQQQMNGRYNGNSPLLNGAPEYANNIYSNKNINGFGYNPVTRVHNNYNDPTIGGQVHQNQEQGLWSQAQKDTLNPGFDQSKNAGSQQVLPQATQENFNIQGGMNDMIKNVDNIGLSKPNENASQLPLENNPQPVNAGTAPQQDQTVANPNNEATIPPPNIDSSIGGGTVPYPELTGYKDNWDPVAAGDQPVFWHIPKAGGSTVKDIMGTCHRFTMASEYGIVEGHENDPEIAVVRPGGIPVDQDPSPFVNVDPTTIPGIAHAKQLGLAESGLADCIVTPYIKESDTLFSPGAQGRLFTVFRHPVDRAVSMFFYIQIADWEPTYNPDLAKMTIEEYAQSPLIENNWMVRQLTSSFEGDLTDDHLAAAMDIIRDKFMVGLLHEKEKTMDRFEKFFRWKYRVNPTNQEKCRENLLTSGSNSNAGNKKVKPKPGDKAYELVAWQNQMDIKLYEFIEKLFVEQEQLVADVPDGFRMMDSSCAKCVPPTFPDPALAALSKG